MIDLTNTPLVETEWLAAHLDDPDLRVVDARWRGDGSGREVYRQGHIQGAVHLDWSTTLSHTEGRVWNLILPPAAFAAMMSASGIGDETRVVVYADKDDSGPGRLWWALRYYGHTQVTVMNGGLTKWQRENRPLSNETPQFPPAQFTPRPQERLLATVKEIEAVLESNDPTVCLVDTRPPEQYAGQAVWTPFGSLFLEEDADWVEIEGQQMRAGHIPGAVHLHTRHVLNRQDWTIHDPETLRQLALQAGIRPEQRVITYCGVGISAAMSLFALHLAGYQNIALYDGSWAEWGTDPDHPMEREESETE